MNLVGLCLAQNGSSLQDAKLLLAIVFDSRFDIGIVNKFEGNLKTLAVCLSWRGESGRKTGKGCSESSKNLHLE